MGFRKKYFTLFEPFKFFSIPGIATLEPWSQWKLMGHILESLTFFVLKAGNFFMKQAKGIIHPVWF